MEPMILFMKGGVDPAQIHAFLREDRTSRMQERSAVRAVSEDSGSLAEPAHWSITGVDDHDRSTFLKTYIDTYTKKDGTVVHAHDDGKGAGHQLVRGRFSWEVHNDGQKVAEYPSHIPRKNVLAHHFAAMEDAAKKKNEAYDRRKVAAANRKVTQANQKVLDDAMQAHKDVIESAHHNRHLKFKPMTKEQFQSAAGINLHQSNSYGKKKGSAYRLVMVDGKPAYARDSDHWGEFNTVDRGVWGKPDLHDGDSWVEDEGSWVKHHKWDLEGHNEKDGAKTTRQYGYVYLDDLKQIRDKDGGGKAMDKAMILFFKAHNAGYTYQRGGPT